MVMLLGSQRRETISSHSKHCAIPQAGQDWNSSSEGDKDKVHGVQVTTLDRSTLELSVLGYSVLPVFCRASDGSQPTDKGDAQVCINAGGFQLPLWPTYPPSSGALRAAALSARPRLPCTSVLLRIMTPPEARAQRYVPASLCIPCPDYGESVDDWATTHSPHVSEVPDVYECILVARQHRIYQQLYCKH